MRGPMRCWWGLVVHWTAVCDKGDGVDAGIVEFQWLERGGVLRSEWGDGYGVGADSDGDGSLVLR